MKTTKKNMAQRNNLLRASTWSLMVVAISWLSAQNPQRAPTPNSSPALQFSRWILGSQSEMPHAGVGLLVPLSTVTAFGSEIKASLFVSKWSQGCRANTPLKKSFGARLAGQTLEPWQQLCELAAREQDPDRLIELICMIQNRLLDEKERCFKNIRNTNHYLPGPSRGVPMRDAYDVLKQKEADLDRVRHQVESLRIVAALLADDLDSDQSDKTDLSSAEKTEDYLLHIVRKKAGPDLEPTGTAGHVFSSILRRSK